MYVCLEAYPIAFQELRAWNPGVGSLPFIAFAVGVIDGGLIAFLFTMTRLKTAYIRTGSVNPEERLLPVIIGRVLLPISMFWFGWTSSPDISWVPQVLAGGFLGAGVVTAFASRYLDQFLNWQVVEDMLI